MVLVAAKAPRPYHGGLCFGAGLTAELDREPPITEDARVKDLSGFEEPYPDPAQGCLYVFRYLSPSDVVRRSESADLRAQVRFLADWIVESDGLLTAAGAQFAR